MSNKKTISIIGLGKMGLGIYNNLNCNQLNLFGYDIDPKVIKKNTHINFLDINKILVISDVIIIVIQSNTQIIPLLKSKKIKKNTVFLDLTTSLPENTIQIAKFLKNININYFDAAMSGGAIGARDGTLTLMIGAEKEQLKENEFILGLIAKNIFYYGKVGSGHSIKLLHNSVCHGIFLMMCEVGQLGEEMGINLYDLIATFNVSNARSFISEERFPKHILNNKFDGNSYLKNLKKDLEMMQNISIKKNSSDHYIKLTNMLLSKFNKNLDNVDFTNIYKYWQDNIKK
jgi:3-hydroxyisobutyrate dehydrogenase